MCVNTCGKRAWVCDKRFFFFLDKCGSNEDDSFCVCYRPSLLSPSLRILKTRGSGGSLSAAAVGAAAMLSVSTRQKRWKHLTQKREWRVTKSGEVNMACDDWESHCVTTGNRM